MSRTAIAVCDWVRSRGVREQVLMLCALLLVISTVSYTQVRQPLKARHAELSVSIDLHERSIAQARAAGKLERPAGQSSAEIPDIIADTAPRAGLEVQRIEPEGARTGVILEEAAFERLLPWLDTLVRYHGLNIATIELVRRPTPGSVATRITLER